MFCEKWSVRSAGSVGEDLHRLRARQRTCNQCQKAAQRFIELFSRLRVESSRTSGWTFGADTDTDSLFSGGVSDHVPGRRLGRPSGHFGWSLTPRDWYWRPHGQWRYQAGVMERRPTTMACNLRGDLQLSSVFGARESPAPAFEDSLGAVPPRGEHLARGPVPPPCSPLEALD